MCDEFTERDNEKKLAEKRLGRREFGVGVGATAAVVMIAGCDDGEDDPAEPDAGGATSGKGAAGGKGGAGGASGKGGASGASGASGKAGAAGDNSDDAGINDAVTSSTVEIETPDGKLDAFFVHPTTGKHPAVIVWPDILGLREGFETMGTRLAADGFAVVVLNQYYRSAKAPVFQSWADWQTPDGMAKTTEWRMALTPEAITRDGAAVVEWLDKQSVVDTGKKIGSSGYCMGGPFTIRTAASSPERVGAAASFHGGGLVTTAENSPHKLFADIEAALLIAIAQNDDARAPEEKTTLKEAADAAGLEAEVEVYQADHGWCAIDSAAFDEEDANKAYDRMVAIFKKAL
ncbi:MAG TPA: dienelactone hydrolase family protein [Polyangiales bacterium]|nr:dienelactone hydrolase family protein [Polyangiales bacterium]